ncbi:MAG: hypothetical protein Q4E33_01640 [Erysipelotrichaceae bacterium]|nr:hypothetical protein [Erysipelotrichaceae bacterium]
MNSTLLLFTFAIVVYMTIKNIQTLKKYRQTKGYVECFNKVKEQGDCAYDDVLTYLNNEKSEELKAKAKLFKLYIELDKYPDKVDETFEDLSFKEIFENKGKFALEKALTNADIFVWYIMCLARAKRVNRVDMLEKMMKKLCIYQDELGVMVEYQLVAAVYKALAKLEDSGVEFFNILLNGEYTKLRYEKRFIGIYKRFAACTLLYLAENISDYDKEDLKIFTESYIGKQYMIELGLYDSYIKTFESIDLSNDKPAEEE